MDKYRSKYEERQAKHLRRAGIKFKYESLTLEYVWPSKNAKYTPDWLITSNGIVIETKGKFTVQDRQKHLLIQSTYPDLDIRFVFMRDNKIHKKSKMRYSTWCEKHGFMYAIGDIPLEWCKQ